MKWKTQPQTIKNFMEHYKVHHDIKRCFISVTWETHDYWYRLDNSTKIRLRQAQKYENNKLHLLNTIRKNVQRSRNDQWVLNYTQYLLKLPYQL